MPFKSVHVPAETLVDLGDLIVYYAYKDEDIETPLSYWYSIEEDSDCLFDVRDLPGYDAEEEIRFRLAYAAEHEEGEHKYPMRLYHAQVLTKLYDAGELEKLIA